MAEDRMLSDEILLGLIKKNGGGGGTTDYDDLSNKPQIAGVTLSGNKSLADLGIASAQDVKKEFIGTSYEWEQLSVEQRKEYDTFQFTDDYSDANYIYLPTIYSTKEKQVGVWTDGKPLYQKTVVIDNPVSTGTKTSIAHGIADVETIVDICGGAYLSSTIIDINSFGSSGYYTFVYASQTDIAYELKWGSSTFTKIRATLKYTKSTDTAGSGIWTPSGQIAEHYSTDEEIVGTWIDGKKVYRVVYQPSSAVVVAKDNWTDIGMSASGIGTLLEITGIAADGACCAMVGAKDNGKIICLESRPDGAFTAVTFVLKYVEPSV